ncbi:hypothetical protein B0H67DRAFT_255307 [Lasiosphaeris hirsuta]|uniref:Uncharacterized protein n=1 Tax=Lasiosphaeris hirsuta TaxID=260670 RepID=A0AA40AHJ7_9PEZI|nr:hypothetical protein B0H67DRAFT_255307 [Lasiosphaeris hirsuta]
MTSVILKGLMVLAVATVADGRNLDLPFSITAAPSHLYSQSYSQFGMSSPIRTVVTVNSNEIDVLAANEKDVPKVLEKLRQLCAGPYASMYPEICEHLNQSSGSEKDPVIWWPPDEITPEIITTTHRRASSSIYTAIPSREPRTSLSGKSRTRGITIVLPPAGGTSVESATITRTATATAAAITIATATVTAAPVATATATTTATAISTSIIRTTRRITRVATRVTQASPSRVPSTLSRQTLSQYSPSGQYPTTLQSEPKASKGHDTTKTTQLTEETPLDCPWKTAGGEGSDPDDPSPCTVITIYQHSIITRKPTSTTRLGHAISNVYSPSSRPSTDLLVPTPSPSPLVSQPQGVLSPPPQQTNVRSPSTLLRLTRRADSTDCCTQTLPRLAKVRNFQTSTEYPGTVTSTSSIECACPNLTVVTLGAPGIQIRPDNY